MKISALLSGVCLLSAGLLAQAGTSNVDFNTTYQTIRGFGASTAWTSVLSTAQANAAWGTSGSQLGLSINRARIDPGGQANWATELANAKLATARGAIEFATPWSAPAYMKSNNNVVGGSLSTSYYGAYATYLESFVNYMSSNGVNLYAISMQNEPDYVPNYESCGWSAQQMDTWVKNNASVLTTKLMMPESASFNFNQSDTTLNDSSAVGHVSIVAGHLYGGTIPYYSNAVSHGKDVWATEHYLTPSGNWPAIGDGIAAAREVHTAMTVGSYNAYVWWWIAQNSGNANINYGLIDNNGNPTYYGYALGQYARFVRSGSVRVSANSPSSGVDVSAYKTSTGGSIVAINSNGSAVSTTFSLQGLSPSSVTPWQTTAAGGLMQQNAVNVSNGSFTYTLPAQSIVTFVTSGSAASCTSVPNAPANASATAVSSSNINLSWSAVTPPANCSISSYSVHRSTTSGFTASSSNQIDTTTSTGFSDSGLNAATTYYYLVQAIDAAGTSSSSSQASATTQANGNCTNTPSAPSNLSATAVSSSNINLGWNAVTPPTNCSISSYAVYRSTTSGFTPSASNQIATTTGTSFSDTGLSSSTTYYYVVQAVDAAGSSPSSTQAAAVTQAASGGINSSAWYRITTTLNNAGLCLEDANGSTANGAVLRQASCLNGQYNQAWQLRPAATNGYYEIFNRYATSLVWDNTGGSTANGNKIQLYTNNAGNRNQEWQPVSLGNNLWKFVNLASGLCLDSTSSSGTGIQMQQWQCMSGSSAQTFQLTVVQ